jgi:aminobenzoyl-glutamate transport protein
MLRPGYALRVPRGRAASFPFSEGSPVATAAPQAGLLRRLILRALDRIERVGNKLPDPLSLFAILIGLTMVVSWLAAANGVGATHPGTGNRIEAVNLFAAAQLRRILMEMPQTFAAFPPLGLVLVIMLGIGVAERSGLIAAALKGFVRAMPRSLLSGALVFAGMMSSLAVDAGYVVLIPLGAVIFHSVGRHPIAGLAAAFAGVSGGFSANLLVTSLDPLLAGFTQPAAQLLDATYTVLPTANYYMMIALVPLFAVLGGWITDRILEPRLGSWDRSEAAESFADSEGDDASKPLTDVERRGLRWAGVSILLLAAAVVALVVPEGAPLRNPDGGEFLVQRIDPFLRSMVAILAITFFVPGLVYGLVTRSIRTDRDVARMTAESMSSMGVYIVLAFAAAHLVAFFAWSNLGLITAIGGAGFLKSIGFTGIPLLVGFVLVSATINLFIGSASAKWAIMAPVFVPMFMLLGYSPELTQSAYRIGDSVTNILTPLLPYFPLVVVFARKYQRDLGIGTLVASMLPYSVAFGIGGILLLIGWMLGGFPLGPGSPLDYVPG